MSTTSTRMSVLASCILSLGVAVIPARAVDPPNKKVVRFDALGDALPEGAVARLGTLRLVHRGPVATVAVSPDGKLVASGVHHVSTLTRLEGISDTHVPDENRTKVSPEGIRLWDTRTGKLIRELPTPNGQAAHLLFSEDGAELYGAYGNFLGCWNPHTGEQRWQKSPPDKGPLHTPFSASNLVLAGDRLVSVHTGNLNCEIRGDNWAAGASHAQRAVRIWNRKTGVLEALPKALESTNVTGKDIPILFHNVAVSVDGRFAAVICSYARLPWLAKGAIKGTEKEDKIASWQYPNPRFCIIDLATGVVRHDFPAANIENTHLNFRDDGHLLAIAAGKDLWILDVATGDKKRVATGVSEIQKLRFIPGTQQIAVQIANQSIGVWDYKTGRAIGPNSVRNDQFHASPNSPITAIGYGNSILLLDRDSGKSLLDFEGHRETPSICFGSGPENMLSSLDSEHLFQWEPGTWKVNQLLRRQAIAHSGWNRDRWRYGISGSTVSPDKGLILKDDEKTLSLHDLKTGKLVRTLDSGDSKRWSSYFSWNGGRVITTEEKRIVSFDVATGKRLAAIDHISGHPLLMFGFGPSCSPAVSYTASFYAKSDKCIDVDLIKMDTGKHLHKLSGAKGTDADSRFAILQLWFSPDERFILAEIHRRLSDNSSDESVELVIWDTERGTIVQELVIVPRMQVWHRSSLQNSSLQSLAMSFDRRHIALTRNYHSEIEIWDTASATRRGVLSGHEGTVTDLAFSRDGRYLASASDDTTILVWDLDRPLHGLQHNDKVTEADVAANWRSLAEPDAAKADRLIWHLVKAKSVSTTFLKSHLRPQKHPNPMHVKRLIEDLDSGEFKARSLAQAELERLGVLVLSDLKIALSKKGSLERQRRIEILLVHAERAARLFGTPDQLREWRTLEVLERIGGPEAVEVLQALAAGSPSLLLTDNAAEVLVRLRRARK